MYITLLAGFILTLIAMGAFCFGFLLFFFSGGVGVGLVLVCFSQPKYTVCMFGNISCFTA